jgi:hypothetical protein
VGPNARSAAAEQLANWELVTLACYLGGGSTKLVHSEDVALGAFQLAPGRFCWKKYPQYPDLDSVRVALFDAAKEKNGALVSGSKDSGWSVTRKGLAWVEETRNKCPDLFSGRVADAQDRRSDQAAAAEREADRLRQSEAFHKWRARSGDLTVYDFFAATRTSSYLPPRQMKLRHAQLARFVREDSELARFVDDLFDRYGSTYQSTAE